MANTKSAEKRHLQNVARRDRNRAQRSRMRTAVKTLRAAIAQGEAGRARELLAPTLKVVDMTASKGVIHANTAARTKSRLTRAVAGLAG
jgi:small subunit ribosomal protein S20